MSVKLFIIGLPGSGKSAIARFINPYAKTKLFQSTEKHWSTKRFNDFDHLNWMSKHPTEGKMFRPAEPEGFIMIDAIAADLALQRLEVEVVGYISSNVNQNEIVIIEFARNDYRRAFKQLSQAFFQDAYFIYLGAEVETCKQRISRRVSNPTYPEDDYPVSDHIFESYYYGDDGKLLAQILEMYGVDEQRVRVIYNDGMEQSIHGIIEEFIDLIISDGEIDKPGETSSTYM
ncbi:MAG TPA: hypothetical protein VNE38_13915 [Ktedonobacteraceae bacterium]|nr:hypothetical protein [Ktedonobacteraceae bacterium]